MHYDQQEEINTISPCGSSFLDELFEQATQDTYLTVNKPFSFFVVLLGSENLMFRKDYHRNNYIV
jgi:hypothetical protein